MNLRRIVKEFSFIRGNFLILLASWTLMTFAASVPETYYSLYVLALGGTEATIGVIGFASSIILALIQFPGGYLADKHGRRWLVVVMTFGVALSYLAYALAQSWQFILAAAILQNIFLIYQPALTAMSVDSIPSEKRGMGFSTQTLLLNIARLLAPVIAGALYLIAGLMVTMRVGYSITFILFIVAGILRTRLRETLRANATRPSGAEILRSYPRSVKESISVWKHLPRGALYLFLVTAFFQLFALMCSPFLVVYAMKILTIGGPQWALILALVSVSRMVSALPMGKIIDRSGRRAPLLLSLLLLFPSMMLFLYGNFHMLIVAALLFGVSESTWGIAQQSLQADLIPREHRGKAVGCIQFAALLLGGVGQLAGGILYRQFSPQIPFLLFAVSSLILAAVTTVFIHEPARREN